MRSIPRDIDLAELHDALAAHWNLTFGSLDYFPQGGGAHHWLGRTGERRWIVTVDDLETKPWLGPDRDSVFAGLVQAYQTALELRRTAGLSFVVAPEPGLRGACAVPLSARYSVAVFPFVDGEAGQWNQAVDAGGRTRVVHLLARLHQASPAPRAARRHTPLVPGRGPFDVALADLDRSWNAGPFAEPVRRLLAGHRDAIAGWFLRFDELAEAVRRSGAEPVVTHGEPHPGNLIRTRDGYALLDWDTVALAEPERDLWMLDGADGTTRAAYQELTGRTLDPRATALYELAWKLQDLASFTSELRAPHEHNPDTERALTALEQILRGLEPTPYGALSLAEQRRPLA